MPANWIQEATSLLHTLVTPFGIKASQSKEANYSAIFTRDAVMAGVAGILMNDARVLEGLKQTLLHLRQLQGPHGQIASNFTIAGEAVQHVSYGGLSPKIDAVTWYLVGVGLGVRTGLLKREDWASSVRQAIDLLDALEYNKKHLIYIAEGGNWADEYVYEGYILYDQLLRYWGLKLAGEIWNVDDWIEKARHIQRVILLNYSPHDDPAFSDQALYHPVARSRRPTLPGPCLYATFTPSGYSAVFDLAANCLFALLNPEMPVTTTLLDWISRDFLFADKLPPAFFPVIEPGDPQWPAISNFYIFSFKNRPHHYHNGGIWWIWLGWLALALHVNRRTDDLARLVWLQQSALEQNPGFAFQEYLDGAQYQPDGTSYMAYSATGLLMTQYAERNANHSTGINLLL